MRIKYDGNLLIASTVTALMVSGFAYAQEAQPRPRQSKSNVEADQPNQPRRGEAAGVDSREQRRDAGTKAGATWGDQQIVECLIMENENEIAVAQIAQRQASSPEVKGFAQTMIKDHGEFIAKLQRFTGSPQADARTGRRPDAQPRTQTATQPETPEARSDRPDAQPQQPIVRQESDTARVRQPGTDVAGTRTRGGRTDFVAIHREIGDKCLQSIKTELESKDGKEFDQCFMNLQAMSHTKMVASLEVLQKHVSPDLREVLKEGHDTTKQHLEKAKQLAKNLDDDSSVRSAKRNQVRNE
ncbi:MAG TPA: DUF4142 domain-containing protein [Pirellulaceae bacterium]|nr:DUF4142 domain-containing protein [Pirellulaceae bacterium]